MSVRARVANWPLAWKVPLLAAGLLIGVAFVISQIVLNRLESDQENNLRHLTSAYLDGLSTAVLRSAIHADVWETFDALDRARDRYAGLKVRFAIVALPNGKVLAASDPLKFPVQSPVPADIEERFPTQDGLIIDTASGRALLTRSLREEGYSVGRILAEIDISELLRVRRQVLLTLVAVNAGLALGFATIGSFALRRMLKPLSVLSGYVERVRAGRADPIPESKRRHISREFDLLFDRFNSMARALNEHEELASHLANQEKYAVLGKLASGMAHEVNNPLGRPLQCSRHIAPPRRRRQGARSDAEPSRTRAYPHPKRCGFDSRDVQARGRRQVAAPDRYRRSSIAHRTGSLAKAASDRLGQ